MVMTSDMYHLMFERIRPDECMILKLDKVKKERNKKNAVDKKSVRYDYIAAV